MNTIFRNFITILKRFRLASSLNILGLSVGFAAFMVIMMQVKWEYSFDTYAQDSDRIYRVNSISNQDMGEGMWEAAIISRGAYQMIENALTTIDDATFVEMNFGTKTYMTVEKDGQNVGFNEFVDIAWDTFPKFFGLKIVDGSFDKFGEPNTLILPVSMAKKMFGNVKVAGKSIISGSGSNIYEIVAVFEDIPSNQQISNNIYMSFPKSKHDNHWYASNYIAYLKLNKNSTFEQLESEMKSLDVSKALWVDQFKPTPIEEIYFDAEKYYGDEFLSKKGDKSTTNILISIGLLIIIVAAINFVNFSTSMAPLRIKSINIQKVLGSQVATLRMTLICEAAGISLLSFLVSLLWIYGIMGSPWQNMNEAGIRFEGNVELIIITAVIALVVGVIAGVYPAFYTTKFAPALILKGSFGLSRSGRKLRLSLVGIQFVISISLIISAMFLQLQNDYMRNLDKGFKSNQILVASLGGELVKNRDAFENQLKTSAFIQDIAYCQMRMGRNNIVQGWAKEFKDGQQGNFAAIFTSWNFPQLMGMNIVDGAPMEFSETKNKKVTYYYIFNEIARKQFEIEMGQKLDQQDSIYSIVHSFVGNYNFKSLRHSVGPMALVVGGGNMQHRLDYAYIKIEGDTYSAFEHVKNVARNIDPVYPIEVEFYDDGFNVMYKQDIQTTKLITFFSVLAIFISLVGVFGLIVFETQYKRKEIGVRKIMGSTVSQILMMLNKKFMIIVGVCFVVAVVITYFAVGTWLTNFEYRTPMHWWVFVCGGLIVFGITIIVVTFQSYRSATENPVKSLKTE